MLFIFRISFRKHFRFQVLFWSVQSERNHRHIRALILYVTLTCTARYASPVFYLVILNYNKLHDFYLPVIFRKNFQFQVLFWRVQSKRNHWQVRALVPWHTLTCTARYATSCARAGSTWISTWGDTSTARSSKSSKNGSAGGATCVRFRARTRRPWSFTSRERSTN